MNEISAPYRFVPLAPFVVVPEWGKLVSHDHPFDDGISGELTIDITCKTPLCIGGERIEATHYETGIVHFFKTPDGQYAIPGTSIKGMLRNVFEIASFSRFNQVEDRKMGMRDLQNKSSYVQTMIKNPSKAGWLRFVEGKWLIIPCQYLRVHQKYIIDYFKISRQDWLDTKNEKYKTAKSRYQAFGELCPPIKFTDDLENKSKQSVKLDAINGKEDGFLVVTGQPGANFEQKGGKKYEFIFHKTEKQDKALVVPSEVKAGFDQIYEDSDDWHYLKSKMNIKDMTAPGIPIFYHVKNGEVESMGLSLMYRVPYKNSLHDAIKHSSEEHLSRDFPDFSDLVFGFIGENDSEGNGLKGRVSFNMAVANTDLTTQLSERTILSSPKPSFYPAYIKQDKKDYTTLMNERPKLSGWKRYPIKDIELPELNSKSTENNQVQVRLESVSSGSQFTQKIRFHNLRRVELGALLWSLDFGGNERCFHGLGMGKPLGFGAVQLKVISQKLRTNEPSVIDDVDLLNVCKIEFIEYMDTAISTLSQDVKWIDTPHIKALMTYAYHEANVKDGMDQYDLTYIDDPKKFVMLKRLGYLEDIQAAFHSYSILESKASKGKSNYYPQINHLGNFDKYMDIVKKNKQANELKLKMAEEKEALNRLRDELSAEKIAVLDLEIAFKAWTTDKGQTKVKTLESKLKEVESVIAILDAESLEKVKEIAYQCADASNAIGKRVKRIGQFNQ